MNPETARQQENTDSTPTVTEREIRLGDGQRKPRKATRQGKDGRLKTGKEIETSKVFQMDQAQQPRNRAVKHMLESGIRGIRSTFEAVGKQLKKTHAESAKAWVPFAQAMAAYLHQQAVLKPEQREDRGQFALFLFDTGALEAYDRKNVGKGSITRHIAMGRWCDAALWNKAEKAGLAKGVTIDGKKFTTFDEALEKSGRGVWAVYAAFADQIRKVREESGGGRQKQPPAETVQEAVQRLMSDLKVTVADSSDDAEEGDTVRESVSGNVKHTIDAMVALAETVKDILTEKQIEKAISRITKAFGKPYVAEKSDKVAA
jgi:hypothetical protein